MNIHQAIKIREKCLLYDVLGRVYIVHNYYLQFFDGRLVNVYLDLKNEFGDKFDNISHKQLYFSMEEFSDAELAFISWVKGDYWLSSTKDLYTIDHDDLDMIRKCFVQGFYTGIEYNDDLRN